MTPEQAQKERARLERAIQEHEDEIVNISGQLAKLSRISGEAPRKREVVEPPLTPLTPDEPDDEPDEDYEGLTT